MHRWLRGNRLVRSIDPHHQYRARLDVVVCLSAVRIRDKVRERTVLYPLPVVLAADIAAEEIELVEEKVVTEGARPPEIGAIGELSIQARVLYLILGSAVHHDGHASVGAKPVVSVSPHVFGILG